MTNITDEAFNELISWADENDLSTKKFPRNKEKLENLQYLQIDSSDSLTSLPESIGQLTGLQTLIIQENENLTCLPESIGQLTQLQLLDISYNQNLTSLPEAIEELAGISDLNIEMNGDEYDEDDEDEDSTSIVLYKTVIQETLVKYSANIDIDSKDLMKLENGEISVRDLADMYGVEIDSFEFDKPLDDNYSYDWERS